MVKTIAAVIALALCVGGCASGVGVIDAYDVQPRADHEVAFLFTPRDGTYADGRSGGLLSSVDGRVVGSFTDGYPWMSRVLPGSVMLKVRCYAPALRLESFRLLAATLRAGHYYELVCSLTSASYSDRGTDYQAVRPLLHPTVPEELGR